MGCQAHGLLKMAETNAEQLGRNRQRKLINKNKRGEAHGDVSCVVLGIRSGSR